MSANISDFGSATTTDSPRRMLWNRAGRMTPLDFMVPLAPKTAMCLLSRVSSGRQMTEPRSVLPRMIPFARSGPATSSTERISFSLIQPDVP